MSDRDTLLSIVITKINILLIQNDQHIASLLH